MVVFGGSYGIGADIAALGRAVRRRRCTCSAGPPPAPTSSAATRSRRGRAQVLAATGRVDFVVNTAGVLHRGELEETSEETIYEATEVNYLAPVFIAQEFYPHLRGPVAGCCCSPRARTPAAAAGYSLYSSAKAAVVNLTQALADEWASSGVAGELRQPRADRHPDAHQGLRRRAAGQPAGLRDGGPVRRCDVMLSGSTGHVVDVRRADPFASHLASSDAAAGVHEAEPGDEMPTGADQVTSG